jgi:hypothetical protein
MANRHWSTDALIARTDVALALAQSRENSSPPRVQLRLDFLNIVSAVDFQTLKSDEAIPLLEEILRKVRQDD